MFNFMNLTDFLSSNMYMLGCIVCFIFCFLISFIDEDSQIYEKHNDGNITIYPFMFLLICLWSLTSWVGLGIIILILLVNYINDNN